MMWGASWLADYPDGENFMQLLYGPNTGQSNNGCYESRDFDEFYEKMMRLPDSPARNRLFLEMTRQMEVDGAWVFGTSRERNQLVWPWVKGYKKHPDHALRLHLPRHRRQAPGVTMRHRIVASTRRRRARAARRQPARSCPPPRPPTRAR